MHRPCQVLHCTWGIRGSELAREISNPGRGSLQCSVPVVHQKALNGRRVHCSGVWCSLCVCTVVLNTSTSYTIERKMWHATTKQGRTPGRVRYRIPLRYIKIYNIVSSETSIFSTRKQTALPYSRAQWYSLPSVNHSEVFATNKRKYGPHNPQPVTLIAGVSLGRWLPLSRWSTRNCLASPGPPGNVYL